MHLPEEVGEEENNHSRIIVIGGKNVYLSIGIVCAVQSGRWCFVEGVY